MKEIDQYMVSRWRNACGQPVCANPGPSNWMMPRSLDYCGAVVHTATMPANASRRIYEMVVLELVERALRLHDAGEHKAARQLAHSLPWDPYDHGTARDFCSIRVAHLLLRYPKSRSEAEFDDIALDFALDMMPKLRGSEGHILAVKDGEPPDRFWSHPEFRKAAGFYCDHLFKDWYDKKHPRTAGSGRTFAGSIDHVERDADGDPTGPVERPDPNAIDALGAFVGRETGSAARRTVYRILNRLNQLTATHRKIIRRRLEWIGRDGGAHGFVNHLVQNDPGVSHKAMRQRVKDATDGFEDAVWQLHASPLQVILNQSAYDGPDPYTQTERIVLEQCVRLAGTVRRRVLIERIERVLKDLDLASQPPWNTPGKLPSAIAEVREKLARKFSVVHMISLWEYPLPED